MISQSIEILVARFDWVKYIEKCGPIVPHGTKLNEFLITCPACQKEQHLGINIKIGKWHCFRCNIAGVSLVNFVMAVENCSWRHAVELIQAGAADAPAIDVDAVKTVLEQLDGLDDIVPLRAFEVPLPTDYIPLYNCQIPYTISRRLSQDTINRQKIGYCAIGTYANYLIIPDLDANQRVIYWMGRNMGPGKPKTKNPPKEVIATGSGDQLFNYHRAINYPRVILTEGWADALRVGDDAVAAYGVGIKGRQLALLVMGGFKEVVVMWDSDVGWEEIIDTSTLLIPYFHVKVVKLAEGDPDSYNRTMLRGLIDTASAVPSKTEFLSPGKLAT